MEQLQLSEPQRLFARSKYKFPAFVGGFGSGKTLAGVVRALSLKSQCIGQNVGYYLPTYSLVNDIALPRFAEVMDCYKIKATIVKSAPQRIDIPGYRGSILFRTMDSPEKIVGYEVAHSIIDELDTLEMIKAKEAWDKIIARNRQRCLLMNSVGVVTTPEGFRFVHDRWVRKGGKHYKLYKARTRDNAKHLPTGYIESLQETYTTSLLQAYLEGEFVNLTAGSVYTNYSRIRNFTNDFVRPGDALHIGMDFNVTKMSAIVHVLRNGKPRAVYEFTSLADTPAMIRAIRAKFPHHRILVYPDASGKGTHSTNASMSDITLLRAAGFAVCVNPSNPAVKDRVLAMNKILETGEYSINPDLCPVYVESLEKQAYDKHGEPDKKAGHDHAVDAGGYFIVYKFPVVKRTATVYQLRM